MGRRICPLCEHYSTCKFWEILIKVDDADMLFFARNHNLDTIKLCETVGFKLIDRGYFDLPGKSFWKILYHRKYPDVSEVKYEDILVFEKSVAVPPNRGSE